MIKFNSIFYVFMVVMLLANPALYAMKKSISLAGRSLEAALKSGEYTINPVGQATQKFVLDTLHGVYPELREREVQVAQSPRLKGFQAIKVYDIKTKELLDGEIINVPFNDQELTLAENLKQESAAIGYKEAHQRLINLIPERFNDEQLSRAEQNVVFMNAMLPRVHSLLEGWGYASRSTTLDYWKYALLHEGCHIKYNDMANNLAYKLKYKELENMQQSSTSLDVLYQAACTVPYFFHAYYAEYRADHEAIKRVSDVAILKAAFRHFSAEIGTSSQSEKLRTFLQKSMPVKMATLLTQHPSDETRARYLAQATKKLEKKLKIKEKD